MLRPPLESENGGEGYQAITYTKVSGTFSRGERGQAGHEVLPDGVVPEDDAPLQSPHHHMVQGVRGIQARLERHGGPKATTTCTTWQRPVFIDGFIDRRNLLWQGEDGRVPCYGSRSGMQGGFI